MQFDNNSVMILKTNEYLIVILQHLFQQIFDPPEKWHIEATVNKRNLGAYG